MDRQEQILSLGDIVHILVSKQMRKFTYGWTSRDDLISEAWLAAIQAVDRFDPRRGCLLKTYASAVIEHRLQDYLRVIDPLTRQHRLQVKAGECDPVMFVPIEKARLRRTPSGCDQIEARVDAAGLLAGTVLTPVERASVTGTWMAQVMPRRYAKQIGVTEGAVSQSIGRAIRKMAAAAGAR